jgi:hypothetical protein
MPPPPRLVWLFFIASVSGGCPSPIISSTDNPSGDAAPAHPIPDLAPFPDLPALPDGSPEVESCAEQAHSAPRVAVDLLFLVDRSASMTELASPQRTKWQMAQDALGAFFKDARSAGLGAGLQYFPLVTACTAHADCGSIGSAMGNLVCSDRRVCAGADGATEPMRPCGAPLDVSCPTGTSCVSLGYCSATARPCTELGRPCPGNVPGNVCGATPLVCREVKDETCQAGDYRRLAVPFGVLPGHASELATSVAITMPQGGTPTGPAVQAALEELGVRAAANPDRKPALVLVTDGLPNGCAANPVTAVGGLISSARQGSPSIATYAIGVLAPGSAGRESLDGWAAAGGTGAAVVLDSNEELGQRLIEALERIRAAALPCEYLIPRPSMGELDYRKVNVRVTDSMGAMDVGYVGSAERCDPSRGGWYYDIDPDKATPTRVKICDLTCRRFKDDPRGSVELRFGCATRLIE